MDPWYWYFPYLVRWLSNPRRANRWLNEKRFEHFKRGAYDAYWSVSLDGGEKTVCPQCGLLIARGNRSEHAKFHYDEGLENA